MRASAFCRVCWALAFFGILLLAGVNGLPLLSPCVALAANAGGQGDDAVTFGTSQLESPHFSDKGQAQQWRDPETGDIVTSVVPPRAPQEDPYGQMLLLPQVYPDVMSPYDHSYNNGRWRHPHDRRNDNGRWQNPPQRPRAGIPPDGSRREPFAHDRDYRPNLPDRYFPRSAPGQFYDSDRIRGRRDIRPCPPYMPQDWR